MTLSLFTACGNKIDDKSDSSEIDPSITALVSFLNYMEAAKVDYVEAVNEYRHFEDEETRQLTIEHACLVLYYEILRIEKLSSELWEIEFFSQTEVFERGFYCVNYVGLIDGEYRIMGNIEQIPDDLKEGVDIEEYETHGPDIV